MDMIFVLFYLLALLTGVMAIFFSSQLLKIYKFEFLRFINLFIIFSVVFSFFNWIAPEIIITLSKDLTNISAPFLIVLSRTLGFPFLIFKLYFLFQLIQKLSPQTVKLRSKYLFLTLIFSLLIIHPIIIINFFKDQLGDIGGFYKRIEGHLLVAIQFFLIFVLIIKTRSYKKTNPKYAGKIFGLWYLLGFSVAVLGVTFRIGLTLGYYRSMALFLLLLFPPLIFTRLFLKKHHFQTPPDVRIKNSLKNFSLNYQLTSREKEILNLIIQNKTNQEIEDLLYISIQTVKNNISTIYKKTDVKNRHHLIRKFNNS